MPVSAQTRSFADTLKRDFARANLTVGNAIGGLALATRECAALDDQPPHFARELREIADLLDRADQLARENGW